MYMAPTGTVQQLAAIHAKSPIATITQNKDFSLYAHERDAAIAKWCAAQKPPVIFNNDSEDYDIVRSQELLLPDMKPYTVLAAYYKRFIKEGLTRDVNKTKLPKAAFSTGLNINVSHKLSISDIHKFYEPNPDIAQHGGRSNAHKALSVLPTHIHTYDNDRNYPAKNGTTLMSAHLKFGTLSIREMYAALVAIFGKADNSLVRELVFRSFYIKICVARPGLQRSQSFRQDIDDNIQWRRHDDPDYKRLWTAWKEGQTGFPLVDAGMRQLNQTGWMHGRVRMVAATVLTRYFLIDWREGAKYFAQHLVDYDP
jgi:deoxyribodipyrimidine photo-lyase